MLNIIAGLFAVYVSFFINNILILIVFNKIGKHLTYIVSIKKLREVEIWEE